MTEQTLLEATFAGEDFTWDVAQNAGRGYQVPGGTTEIKILCSMSGLVDPSDTSRISVFGSHEPNANWVAQGQFDATEAPVNGGVITLPQVWPWLNIVALIHGTISENVAAQYLP